MLQELIAKLTNVGVPEEVATNICDLDTRATFFWSDKTEVIQKSNGQYVVMLEKSLGDEVFEYLKSQEEPSNDIFTDMRPSYEASLDWERHCR